MANPLVSFTLIKRLHSEWLNVVYSNEALENLQGLFSTFIPHKWIRLEHQINAGVSTKPFPVQAVFCPALRSGYEEEEADLPKMEDLQGAAKGLMRLQDVYALQVSSLVRGLFRRVADGKATDVYMPVVSTLLSGDDCFLVGKVSNFRYSHKIWHLLTAGASFETSLLKTAIFVKTTQNVSKGSEFKL